MFFYSTFFLIFWCFNILHIYFIYIYNLVDWGCIMLNEYEINISTLALISDSKNETLVIENDSEYKVKKKATKIVDSSCKYFGSSLVGRQEGTKNMISTSVKPPIIIEESREIIFFPTSSPRIESCSWISYNNLLKYEKIDKGYTRLYFLGGKNFDLEVSYNIVENQVTRCIRLEKALLRRKKAI